MRLVRFRLGRQEGHESVEAPPDYPVSLEGWCAFVGTWFGWDLLSFLLPAIGSLLSPAAEERRLPEQHKAEQLLDLQVVSLERDCIATRRQFCREASRCLPSRLTRFPLPLPLRTFNQVCSFTITTTTTTSTAPTSSTYNLLFTSVTQREKRRLKATHKN